MIMSTVYWTESLEEKINKNRIKAFLQALYNFAVLQTTKEFLPWEWKQIKEKNIILIIGAPNSLTWNTKTNTSYTTIWYTLWTSIHRMWVIINSLGAHSCTKFLYCFQHNYQITCGAGFLPYINFASEWFHTLWSNKAVMHVGACRPQQHPPFNL